MTRNQKRREYMTEYKRKYRASHPLKYRAQEWVRRAVRAGRLARLPHGMAYHHIDYRKPDLVIPVTLADHRKCHGRRAA